MTFHFFVNATYLNAPYSCTGNVVAANVQVFAYSQCVVNDGSILNITQKIINPDYSTRFIKMRSYRRRLDVCKFTYYIY